MDWNAEHYRSEFGFVAANGMDVLSGLGDVAGLRVLDIGCGTGELTRALAHRGAPVVGLDSSADMVDVARAADANGTATYVVADAHDLPVEGTFDAVFSNAALHWMTDVGAVFTRVHSVLRPGGLFVAEQGGVGNVRAVLDALGSACRTHALPAPRSPWDFPSPAQQATRLESAGFVVRQLALFDRPTPLPDGAGGASGWLRMFGATMLAQLPAAAVPAILTDVDANAAPLLRHGDSWSIDYVRLRFVAQAA